MPSLKEILRSRIFEQMLRAVDPPARWKILVVDPAALRILNAVCRRSDVLAQNVSIIEGLFNKRQPYPDMHAIFFIEPSQESVRALVDDFARSKPPYAAVHLFSTAALPDILFDRIKNSPVSKYLLTVKELNIDFYAPDPESFHFEYPDAWFSLFNPQAPSLQRYELNLIAKRLVSVMGTLGDYPYIRYHTRPTLFSTTPQKSTSQELAFLVQQELDALCRAEPSFPEQTSFKRSVLIIADRSIDPIAPLLHEFSYQAMVSDLVGLDGGKFKDRKDGKESILDETDPIYAEVRTWHIAEVLEHLPVLFERFASENKAAKWELEGKGAGTNDKIQGLKDAMSSLGEYQETKAKYALHTTICEEVMNVYNSRSLETIAEVEQNLVMTDQSDSSAVRARIDDVVRVLDDANIDHMDKIRLVLLAVTALGGVQNTDRQTFLDHGNFTHEETQALTNLSFLHVRLSPVMDSRKTSSKNPYVNQEIQQRSVGKVFKFDNSRYTCMVKFVLEDQCRNCVDPHVFPWVKDPPVGEFGDRPSTWSDNGDGVGVAAPGLVARKKPSWAARKLVSSTGATTPTAGSSSSSPTSTSPHHTDLRLNGPRIILFIIGGMTHSEIRSVSELKKQHQRDILIGSTHVWHADGFVEALKGLHRGNGDVGRFMSFHRPLPELRSVGGSVDRGGSVSSRRVPRDDVYGGTGYDDNDTDSRDGGTSRIQARLRGLESRGDSRNDPRIDPRNGYDQVGSDSRGGSGGRGRASPEPPRGSPRSRDVSRGGIGIGVGGESPERDSRRFVPPRDPNRVGDRNMMGMNRQPVMSSSQPPPVPPMREGPSWNRGGGASRHQPPPPQQVPPQQQYQQPPPQSGYMRGTDQTSRPSVPPQGLRYESRGDARYGSQSSLSPPSTRSNSLRNMYGGGSGGGSPPPPSQSRDVYSQQQQQQQMYYGGGYGASTVPPPPPTSGIGNSRGDYLRSRRPDIDLSSPPVSSRQQRSSPPPPQSSSSKSSKSTSSKSKPSTGDKPKERKGWFGF